MDATASVKITGDTSELSAAMERALDKVKISMAGIRSSIQGVGIAAREGFQEGVRQADAAANGIEKSGNRMERSADGVKGAFGGLKSFLVGLGLAAVGREVLSTAANFEKLRAVLSTLEGGQGAGGARFAELQKFATETPYQLEEVVTAFSKLKARGLDPSNAALRSYGNTAAAMGKSLDQMVEAVGDAATGEFERLKEFGIVARQQGDSVSFTFDGVTTKVAKNSADIQDYLRKIGDEKFGDAMSAQMNTLGGVMSNLKDSAANLADKLVTGGVADALKTVANEMLGAQDQGAALAAKLAGPLAEAVTATWGVIKTLGSVVGQVFQTIADTIRDVVGQNVSNLEIWRNFIGGIRIALITLGTGVQIMAVTVGAAIETCITWFRALAIAADAALNFNFAGAGAALSAAVDRQVEIVRSGVARIKEISAASAGAIAGVVADTKAPVAKSTAPAGGTLNPATGGKGGAFGSAGGAKGGGKAGSKAGADPVSQITADFNRNMNQMDIQSRAAMAKFSANIKKSPVAPAMAAVTKKVKDTWLNGVSQMAGGFGSALARMATLQQGFGQTFRDMWSTLGNAVTNVIAQMLQRFIVSLLVQSAASDAFNAKETIKDAKAAARGAYKAVSGIPVVGPYLAPIAAAAAFTGVMAFSAEGGYSVPEWAGAGVDGRGGQVGIVHPEEMVLPKKEANALRNGAGGGIAVHIHATDAQSVKRLFQDNKAEVASAIKAAIRAGVR